MATYQKAAIFLLATFLCVALLAHRINAVGLPAEQTQHTWLY